MKLSVIIVLFVGFIFNTMPVLSTVDSFDDARVALSKLPLYKPGEPLEEGTFVLDAEKEKLADLLQKQTDIKHLIIDNVDSFSVKNLIAGLEILSTNGFKFKDLQSIDLNRPIFLSSDELTEITRIKANLNPLLLPGSEVNFTY